MNNRLVLIAGFPLNNSRMYVADFLCSMFYASSSVEVKNHKCKRSEKLIYTNVDSASKCKNCDTLWCKDNTHGIWFTLWSRTHYLEYEMELVLDCGAREERPARGHLVENATDAPHINGGGVLGGAQQHVRRPVPQRHHLVTVRLRRHALRPGQPEVRQLK